MENTAQSNAYGLYSDLFKDLHGIRPRWASEWSLERLEAAIEDVSAELAEELKSPEQKLADTVAERDWLTVE
jgi:hypothetical protein